MALYSGITGAVKVGGKEVCMATFTVDITASMGEAACLGAEFKKRKAGINSWTASFDGPVDFSTQDAQDVMDILLGTDKAVFIFELSRSVYFTGTGIVESVAITHDAENIATISGSVKGSGALVPTT